MKNVKKYFINQIPELTILGRNIENAEKQKSLTLFWAGSGFEVEFLGNELWAEFESDYETLEPWIAIFLNGRIAARQMVTKGRHWICLARGFDEFYKTKIQVLKDSQPMTDDPKHYLKINRLALSRGGSFTKVQPKKLKIEFVGDSITTGEGLCGAVDDMDWIATHMSFCKTYAYQTACALDADFRVMSQGGYGIVSAWNNNPYGIIPPHYENVCSIVKGETVKRSSANGLFFNNKNQYKKSAYEKLGGNQKYNFLSWQPDFIVSYLGTNDRGGFYNDEWTDPLTNQKYKMRLGDDGFPLEEDGQKITEGVKNFLSVVRKNNLSSKIIWATGMMKIPEVMKFINRGIEEFESSQEAENLTEDKKIYKIEFDSMDCEKTDDDKGSRAHPGPLTHRTAAKKLTDFIKSLM